MKIGIVCQYFPPESNAPAIRTYEHAREWVRAGHEVTVLTGFPHHPHGVVAEGYRGEWLRREDVDGIEVVRSWVYATANRGKVRRIASFLSFFVSSVLAGRFFADRPDVILGTSPQFFTGVAGYLLSRLHGTPFILEIRDLWPQVAVEMGMVRHGSVAPLVRLQRAMYKAADRIVIVSEGFRQHLLDAGVPEERIAYVPNGIDPEVLSRPVESAASVRRRLGLEDRFVVSYIGTHGLAHALGTVLEAARRLQDHDTIRFLFVGDGAERHALELQARRMGLTNVRFLGQQSRDAAIACYRASDLCLVPLRDLPAFRQVLPSKLFEILGSGVPVVCSVPGEAGDLVRRSGGGVVIPPEDPAALATELLRLYAQPEALAAMGAAGREYVHREHLRPRLAGRLAALMEDLCGEAGALLARRRIASLSVAE